MTRIRLHCPSGSFFAAPVCGGTPNVLDPPLRFWPFGSFPHSGVGVVDRVGGLEFPLSRPSEASNPPKPAETFRDQVSNRP